MAPEKGWNELTGRMVILPEGGSADADLAAALASAVARPSALFVPRYFGGGRLRTAELARFDRELFDRGYVRLKTEIAARIGEGGTLYAYAPDLVRLDWLTPPPEDAVVQIANFPHLGRFANRLFMYFNLTLYRLRSCCGMEIPGWEESELYGFQTPAPSRTLFQQKFAPFHGAERHLLNLDDPQVDVDFFAYFQELTDRHALYKPFIQRLLTPSAYYTFPIDDWLAETVPPEGTLVAVHVRRGDYVNYDSPWFRSIPVEWYLDRLPEVMASVPNPVLYVATDDPVNIIPRFEAYAPVVAPADQLIEARFAPFVDFMVMQRAKVLFMCNSSFSRMAALLSPDDKRVYAPNCPERRFDPYEPWADRAFWDRFGPGVP
jgi:hypothetical protein